MTGGGVIPDQVRRDGLLVAGRAVVVMYSGGRDSTCLLHVAVRIVGGDALGALHVNYGLRDGADGDERHCREVCERLGVRLEVRRPLRPETGNLQAWARDQRYGAAAQLALAAGADVAAGHTSTDQVETILYRLASSPSRRALLGMRAREGRLVRPLLGFTRAETAEYCVAQGLAWREDESNDKFARGRIRSELVPALRTIHPAAEDNVLAVAEILRDEAAVLDGLIDEALEGRRSIPVARLRELPVALQRLVVQRLADAAAGGPAPGTARRVEEITALTPDAALDLPHGVRAVTERGVLRFRRTPQRPRKQGARSAPP
jgi:tRNA(Ile)-lysidine synthase